jgi:hypothetical protein
MKTPMIEAVAAVYAQCEVFTDERIVDLVVSETVQENGERVFLGVWFFTASFAMETQGFPNRLGFDVVSLQRLSRCVMMPRDFDFKTATDRSRLVVQITSGVEFSGTFQASGTNCEALLRTATNILAPALVRP